MEITYYLNFGDDENPLNIKITKTEAKPKSRTADKALHKKYGMSNTAYDKKYPK